MNTILLSIGSNTFAKSNIDKAQRMLTRLFPGILFSEPILSEPDNEKYLFLFRNVLATVVTPQKPDEIIEKIKQTERAVGRTPKDKYLGKVIIDIDLIRYNDEILRPIDYQRAYVQQLLPTLGTPTPVIEEAATPEEADAAEATKTADPKDSTETSEQSPSTDPAPPSEA